MAEDLTFFNIIFDKTVRHIPVLERNRVHKYSCFEQEMGTSCNGYEDLQNYEF